MYVMSSLGTNDPTTLDDAAFRLIYRRLRRYAAVVGRSIDDPDDLVQEALSRLLARADPPEDVESFLRVSISNLAADRHRRQGRFNLRRPLLERERSVHLDAYPSEFTALDDLDPRSRAILWLSHVEGWTFDEIGALLGVSPASARKRASRGRRALGRRLGKESGL